MSPNFTAIIPAAGVGLRLGYQQPKALVVINGEAILKHTVRVFLNLAELSQLVVCCTPGMVDLFQEALTGLLDLEKVLLVEGGATRQLSVAIGVQELLGRGHRPESIVAVHDAARCLVSVELIRRSVLAAVEKGAVSAAVPVSDSLLLQERVADEQQPSEGDPANSANYISRFRPVSRENLWSVQTPQVFTLGSLARAHSSASSSQATDDLSLVQSFEQVSVCLGDRRNIKVTTVEDLEVAGLLLAERVKL